jgi:hypothetical protein
MKTEKVLRSFVARDSRKVVLRTPKWKDLVAEVDGKVVAVSEIGRRRDYGKHVGVIGIDEIIVTKLLE